MTHFRTAMLHRRLSVLLLSLFFALAGTTSASAQSVASIVDQMQARYEDQLETVDTYIVETNLYTSYNQKVMQDGRPTYKTQTRMTGEGSMAFAGSSTPSSAYGMRFDRLKQHATLAGTESIDGMRCYVLQVDDPSKVDPDMGEDTGSMTYYVDANEYLARRMVMQNKPSKKQGPQASSVTINLKNYTTTDGLTLPHRMEIQVAANMSEQQRKKMETVMEQMENMPEQQRKMMERTMGDQLEMMKQMLSGEPVVVEVQSVNVNTPIPSNIF